MENIELPNTSFEAFDLVAKDYSSIGSQWHTLHCAQRVAAVFFTIKRPDVNPKTNSMTYTEED